MRQAHIQDSGLALSYQQAAALAAKLADDDRDVIDPVLVAWYDKKGARMSPVIEGADLHSRWHDYGASHGGKLEVEVGDDFAFIFADSSAFDAYEASPYSNLKDKDGNEYICQINLMDGQSKPTPEACTPLDDWTSKLT